MITKATLWDTNIELSKGISCDWHEERGQMSMIVRTLDGDADITDWSHEKLTDALGMGYIKWGDADSVMDWYRTNDILVEVPCIHKHQVIVGNVGTVRSTYLYNQAESAYEYYSIEQQGRWKNEPVTWMYNGDVYKEYNPMGFAGKLASMLNDSSFDEEPTIMVTVTLRDGSKIVATPHIAMIADVTYPHITILADEVPMEESQDA